MIRVGGGPTRAASVASALVLGGGGVAGVAWELGMLDALAVAGVDLTTAGRVVGTSAGSVVGAQVCSGESLASLCDRQMVADSDSRELAVDLNLDGLIEMFAKCFEGNPGEQEVRARLGAVALAAPTVAESVRRDVIASRLSSHVWSDRELLITTVDAFSGEFVVLDRNSGVAIVDAVGASCAVPGVWPPVTIGDSRFVDGGMRTTANADLASGCDVVVILAPFAGGFGRTVHEEAAELRSSGATVEVIEADAVSLVAFGANPLDPSTRAPSLLEGRRQGSLEAERIAEAWS
jgi:NTE family protein